MKMKNKIRSMINKGFKNIEISKRLGCTPPYVCQVRMNMTKEKKVLKPAVEVKPVTHHTFSPDLKVENTRLRALVRELVSFIQ